MALRRFFSKFFGLTTTINAFQVKYSAQTSKVDALINSFTTIKTDVDKLKAKEDYNKKQFDKIASLQKGLQKTINQSKQLKNQLSGQKNIFNTSLQQLKKNDIEIKNLVEGDFKVFNTKISDLDGRYAKLAQSFNDLQQTKNSYTSLENRIKDLLKAHQENKHIQSPNELTQLRIDLLSSKIDSLQLRTQLLKDQFRESTAQNTAIDEAIQSATQQKNRIKAALQESINKLKSFDQNNVKIIQLAKNYEQNIKRIEQFQKNLKQWNNNKSKLGNHSKNHNSAFVSQKRIDHNHLRIIKDNSRHIAYNFVNKYQIKPSQGNVKYTIKVGKVQLAQNQNYSEIWVGFSSIGALTKEIYQEKQKTRLFIFHTLKIKEQTKGRYGKLLNLCNTDEVQCQADLTKGLVNLTIKTIGKNPSKIPISLEHQGWDKKESLYLEIASMSKIELDLYLPN